jgi:hypothetical protein
MYLNEVESEGVESSKVSQKFVRWWSFVNAIFTKWREISFRAERLTPSQEITSPRTVLFFMKFIAMWQFRTYTIPLVLILPNQT